MPPPLPFRVAGDGENLAAWQHQRQPSVLGRITCAESDSKLLDFVQHALLIMEKVGKGILGLWLAVFRTWKSLLIKL
jgi:hypothetical protein